MTSGVTPVADFSRVRLHIVTGKGGTGKTSVAAALALALASLGRRVLVAEVEGRQGISQTYDVPPLPPTEKLVMRVSGGGEVWGISVDPKAALVEYLELFYRLGRAGKALEKLGAIDFATTIAPGVRDVLSLGKVYEAVRRRGPEPRPDGTPDWRYDAVILDAPPTGRVAQYLGVGGEVADLARVGPIRHQAEAMTQLLRSDMCAVHVVTLLEEMPVQEAADAIDQLTAAQLRIGAVIVNQVHEAYLPEEEGVVPGTNLDPAALATDFAGRLPALGLPHDAATVTALVDQAVAHAARLALEDEQLAVVEALARPVVLLEALPYGVDAETVRTLAADLAVQGAW